ncbi:hypothetical protein TIFTF001_052657 [Ficus carica]|uniref:Uncharacterized protein n=1 Tax=Ficus carica TaxID=3494 RepID=A0AA88JGH3_FICCA|nr:hypothetical protein TIFTF001_052657 [Ficus carica]
MSAKGTSMLNSAFSASPGAQVTLVGRILIGLGGLTCSGCTGTGPPLGECHMPSQSGDGDGAGWWVWRVVWVWRAVSRYCCQQVRDDVVGTAQGRPPRRGFSHGRGSVSRADTMGPHSDMLEIPKG